MPREDVLFEDGDIVINETFSDVVISESDEKHIEDTIRANPGTWPEHPADGVAIMSYLGASGEEQTLQRTVKLQLQADGYQCNNPLAKIENEKVILEPNAKRV